MVHICQEKYALTLPKCLSFTQIQYEGINHVKTNKKLIWENLSNGKIAGDGDVRDTIYIQEIKFSEYIFVEKKKYCSL